MNEKDLELVHSVSSVLTGEEGSSIYLLHVKYTNLVRMNLVLLKAFLEDKKRRGLMITVDRPHQYLSHLMQLHGIDQTNLVFVDAISLHSADTKGGAVAPEFQMGPFHIEALPGFLMKHEDDGSSLQIDMSKIDFVMIDNVSTLLTYNSMESIKLFFQNYVDALKGAKSRGILTALAMDREQHTELYEFIFSLSRKSIELGQDMLVKGVRVMGAQVALPSKAVPDASASVGSGIDGPPISERK
ncbi:MAG: hypothetical protein KJ672_00555 [Candidatus Thermoplasmatota archaeon]|nr:hypothetical protein [Candidatus Thermoplasmatota archaeon]